MIFCLYPNPVKETLYFNTNSIIDTVKIYSLIGQNLATFKRDNLIDNSINISNLSKGIYLLKVFIEGEVATFKITKE